ncbi:MAG: bacterial transcriptional activator domain-containing protein [Oscillibacter sp.]|nr:bacterial transcriptional activator domain-containing protein [Oscillibacter sp.]
MENSVFQVRMLGTFSIRKGDQEINDSDNRSRKIWLLLAYMIYCRSRAISQEELVNLLWSDEDGSSNPLNALKTMFHRARASLNQLDGTAGHSLIIRRSGNYAWNTDIPFFYDVDEFEKQCRLGTAAEDKETKLAAYRKALELYQGDFLPKLSSEPWVVPISAYFHNLYIQVLLDTIPLLSEAGQHEDIVTLCRKAVEVEPYNEQLYQHLMQALLALERQREAAHVYEDMSQLLFDSFGIMPSDEIRALYRDAVRTINDRALSISSLRDQLREPPAAKGALLCDYDFFRVIYHAEARALARSGDAVHICLMSATDNKDEELSKRSLDRCMENLQDVICSNLRRGDIASRCSVSQFIFMLPQANYENSCMVCERVIRAFYRQYPHSPAKLHFAVQPLEPSV